MWEWVKLLGSIAGAVVLIKFYILGSPLLEVGGLGSWLIKYGSSTGSLLTAFLFGIVITAIAHSSSAIIWALAPLLAVGVIHPHMGIAIILGANIGTCVDGFMAWAAFGRNIACLKVATSHLMFNVIGNTVLLPIFFAVRHWIK